MRPHQTDGMTSQPCGCHCGAGRRLGYSRSEAGAIVGVSEQTIARLVERGELMAKRIGTRIVIPDDELRDWFDSLPTALEID
ncbi:excise [Gordonia phage DatBoi]|nr:excise [Gordonia phage DatBoi]